MKKSLPTSNTVPIALKLGLGILYFLFLYSIQFSFIPSAIGTRVMMGMFGGCLLIVRSLSRFNNNSIKISFDIFRVSLCLVFFFATSLFSLLINATSDLSMVKYTFSIIMMLLAAYFVISATIYVYGRDRVTFERVSTYLIGVVVAQVLISLFMFLYPEFRTVMIEIQQIDDFAMTVLNKTGSFRLVGFGSQLFAAGVTNGFALILIGAMFRNSTPPISHGWLIIFFLLITIAGAMMARTTLVGAGMGLLLMFWKARIFKLRITSRLRKATTTLLLTALIGILGYQFIPTDTKDMMSVAIEYGFEMFYNYTESGTISTASSDDLKSMYDIHPTNLSTWLIGDGLFVNPMNASTYYMNTDVGYFRLIFCIGLVGTLAYFAYQISIIMMFNNKTESKYAIVALFFAAYIMMMNVKGFCDLTQYLALFMLLPTVTKNRLI